MAWIQLEDTFHHHHKFNRLARRLGVAPATARGLVASLWSWCINFAFDGDLTRFYPEDIEEAIGWIEVRSALGSQIGSTDRSTDPNPRSELIDAMIDAGFLDRDGDRLVVHEWDDRPNSHKDRLARRRRRLDSKERGADDPVNAAALSGHAAALSVPSSPDKHSLAKRSIGSRGRSEDGSTGARQTRTKKKKPPAEQADVVKAWNEGASGNVGKAAPGSWPDRDALIASRRREYPAASDPEIWTWIARAMSADEHHARGWRRNGGRLRWICEKAKKKHFEHWLEAAVTLRARVEAAERQAADQPEPGEIGSAPSLPEMSDEQSSRTIARAREIREGLRS